MRKRRCALLGGFVLLVLACSRLSSAAPAFAEVRPQEGLFSIGNSGLKAQFRLDSHGQFQVVALVDRQTERDWAPPGLPSPGFHFAGSFLGSEAGSTEWDGMSGWSLDSAGVSVSANGVAELSISLLALSAPLEVRLHYRCFPDAPAIRTWFEVSNSGWTPFELDAADSLEFSLASAAAPLRAIWVRNFTWLHPDDALTTRMADLTPGTAQSLRTGPFGTDAAWLSILDPASGAGVFSLWEWSGSGDLSVSTDSNGAVVLRQGFAEGTFRHLVRGGKSFTSPASVIGVFSGGLEGAGAATRSLVDSHFSLPLPDPKFPWSVFDTWGYGETIDESLVHELVAEASDLGVESFTLDAGWMERLGDWVPKPGAFDAGLAAISADIHGRGMKFGLWMALGSADPNSRVLQDHPDWEANRDGKPFVGDMGGHALCLASPRVQEWILAEVDRIVKDYKVDWLIHDFQVMTSCNAAGHGHQSGDGEWAEVQGYYKILEEIHRRHPGLVLENCWDGGNMLDLGMSSRHHATVLHDRNDSMGNRRGVSAVSYLLPPRYLEKYAGDDGTAPDYRFQSAIPGGSLILMGRPTSWDEETQSSARRAVELFKTWRPLLRDGAFFHLSGNPQPGAWDGVMSYDAASGKGIAFLYRAGSEDDSCVVKLPGLEEGASYQVEVQSDALSAVKAGGEELGADGITVAVRNPEDEAVITFSRVPNR